MPKKDKPEIWMKNVLDSKSPSFCGAKWLDATIWLGNGMTTSCHHPPPHKIHESDIKNNPSGLHNTSYKKLVRKQMQEGVRPEECEYCWKIEDLGRHQISDRFYKSVRHPEKELEDVFNLDWQDNVTPRTLEISFDSNCNFACSYCNAGFSTTWAKDIKNNGAYQDLKSDGWGAFAHDGSWAMPYGTKNKDNPYVEAFLQWWESDLQYSLEELRVTGGEATMSKDFWRFIEWFENNPGCEVRIAVNTNLGVKDWALEKLCSLSNQMPGFSIFTSNESHGQHGEYIRDGLDWKQWLYNYEYMARHGNFHDLHCMLTINALCLASLDKLHEEIFRIREYYYDSSNPYRMDMSYNILRFPSFQSITTLPPEIRKERAQHYKQWMEKHRERMFEHEIDGMSRLISYIEEVTEGHSVRDYSDYKERELDFKSFYLQYDQRRGKNFVDTFADWNDLVEWYKSIPDPTNRNEINELVKGDATEWGAEIHEKVFKEAKDNNIPITNITPDK